MKTIELYINKHLADIDNPGNFSIYLKRQLLNPSELSRKDAQKSYDITLPASPVNNAIFGYTNVEEVKGKFATVYDAALWIDGIKIFDGKFKLSEITGNAYRGNLGVPAQKSMKDIFGEKMMNESAAWLEDFAGIEDITRYNRLSGAPFIFPLVLYGLFRKEVPYSDKDVLDNTVSLNYNDFMPSVNCIKMLKNIFQGEGLTLSGTALDDDRFKGLYVSYKNPEDYEPQWNISEIKLSGEWKNIAGGAVDSKAMVRDNFDMPVGTNAGMSIVRDLFDKDASYASLTIDKDDWGWVTNVNGLHTIVIGTSALYKIEFDASISIDGTVGKRENIFAESESIRHRIGVNEESVKTLSNTISEIKIMRNIDYSIFENQHSEENIYIDRVFLQNNINQTSHVNGNLYPAPGEVLFIDPYQDDYIINGLSWGKPYQTSGNWKIYDNKADNGTYCHPLAMTGGKSWNTDVSDEKGRSAVASPGYLRMNNSSQFTLTDQFKVEMDDAPYTGISLDGSFRSGNGRVSQVVWLNKGDRLNVVSISTTEKSTKNVYTVGSNGSLQLISQNTYSWLSQRLTYNLSIKPFKYTDKWMNINDEGSSRKPLKWNAQSGILSDKLNLTPFLPSNIKINDWIDNFCKAFNLSLNQTDATHFELNLKNTYKVSGVSSIIDLDSKTSIVRRSNQPLKLPYMYELGFTVDKNEEGYYASMKVDDTDDRIPNSGDDGGGTYYTNSPEENKLQQTSSFSHNWFKQIKDELHTREIEVPVITDKEIWTETTSDYETYLDKRYTDKAQRFWYKKENDYLPLTVNWNTTQARSIDIALLTNEYEDGNKQLRLDYADDPVSIMNNFFLLLTDADNCYTVVECHLTPEEYANIDYAWVRLNGDLYYVAEVDGYDPMCRKNTTLKLIRKTL